MKDMIDKIEHSFLSIYHSRTRHLSPLPTPNSLLPFLVLLCEVFFDTISSPEQPDKLLRANIHRAKVVLIIHRHS
jgi:hypothetical protein